MHPGHRCLGGIGRATAARLADAGHLVFAAARRADTLQALAATHPGVRLLPLDITDPAAIDHARHQIIDQTGGNGLDVVINTAGILILGPVEAVADPHPRAQFEVNLFGTLAVTRAFLPAMRDRGQGRIVKVSSSMGRLALPGGGIYAASKFALEAASDALRIELAPFRGAGRAGRAGGHRHRAVCAGRRRPAPGPGPWALSGRLAGGVRVPRAAAASRRHRGHHCCHPGRGGAGGPPSATVPAWAAQPPQHPAADRAAHRVGGSDQAADRRCGVLGPAGPPGPDGAAPPRRAAPPTRRAPTPSGQRGTQTTAT
jgi:NAD(P)-dependent dehydrogenase (short-subunit alcohol dehydrogenase family)